MPQRSQIGIRKVSILLIFMAVGCGKVIPPPTPAPLVPILEDTEIVWLGVTDSYIVSVWADGVVGCWEIDSGKLKTSFSLPDYKFNDVSLCISPGAKPLLASINGSKLDSRCDFYDILTGKSVGVITIAEKAGLWVDGFSKNGRELFCSTSASCAVFRINIKTGKVNRLEHPDDFVMATYFEETGKYFVNVCQDYVACRDWNGRISWKKKVNYYTSQMGKFAGVLHESLITSYILLQNDPGPGVMALSLTDGRQLWSDSTIYKKSIRACSPDGQILATWNKNSLNLIDIREKKHSKFQGIDGDIDAQFTPNGKYLLIATKLVIAEISNQTYTLRRKGNNVVSIIDIKAAKIVGQLALKKPRKKQDK